MVPQGSPKSVFIGFGLATSGPVSAGIVIAVEAGASGSGGGTMAVGGGGSCPWACGAADSCQAVSANSDAAPIVNCLKVSCIIVDSPGERRQRTSRQRPARASSDLLQVAL